MPLSPADVVQNSRYRHCSPTKIRQRKHFGETLFQPHTMHARFCTSRTLPGLIVTLHLRYEADNIPNSQNPKSQLR